MTVLVLSDPHGDVEAMVRAVERTDPDLIVHLGDCWRDAEELRMLFPRIPMEQVPGNCDFRPVRKRHTCIFKHVISLNANIKRILDLQAFEVYANHRVHLSVCKRRHRTDQQKKTTEQRCKPQHQSSAHHALPTFHFKLYSL